MKLTLAVTASLLCATPAFAEPGWFGDDSSIGSYASNDENIALGIYCGSPDMPPLQVTYANDNDDRGNIPDDIAGGTLVVAAGKAKTQRFAAIYEPDNTDFLLTGKNAAAMIDLALLQRGLTIYVEIKGKHYDRGSFDNTGLDKVTGLLKACVAQFEGKP